MFFFLKMKKLRFLKIHSTRRMGGISVFSSQMTVISNIINSYFDKQVRWKPTKFSFVLKELTEFVIKNLLFVHGRNQAIYAEVLSISLLKPELS